VIRVGVAGWSYADWRGRAYPRTGGPDFHPLEYLARFFDCIEINSSFYALPRREHVSGWVERVAARPDFRFCFKLHRDFTHGRLEPSAATETGRMLEPVLEASGGGRHGRLGALLAQFHQDFADRPENRERLLELGRLFGHLPLVLELRHRSWFQLETLASLEQAGLNLAHIDMPAAASVVPQVRSAERLPYFVGPLGYLRLHGRNAEDWYDPDKGRDDSYNWMYGREEVRVFAEYARALAAAGGDTYVVTNNHFGGKAVANGLELLAELRGAPVPGPPEIVAAYPDLADVVRPAGQGTLF
jgi:uncharacterized protein YecE (DUF72 family)